MRDIVYYFDKLSPYARHELGEIQTDFNMNFTVDGSKDSSKMIVRSFSGDEVEPYTILKHEKTNTWWVAINDEVKRYANESGFVYVHTIQFNGAKELLNARDLTDCGFNQNKYTISDFFNRLVKLSKWDFPNVAFNFGNNLYYGQSVDFVKTFENYTLLSAIREFLDGYNCDFTLTFDQNANGSLHNAYINIIPKTGNVDLPILDEDEFKDVREIKKIDKNSFGTTVVSNAENVISSVSKTYPSVGSVRLSGTEYQITQDNAVLRLPSKVYDLKWLKIHYMISLYIYYGNSGYVMKEIYAFDDQIDQALVELKKLLEDDTSISQEDIDYFFNSVQQNKDSIYKSLRDAGTITLYEGNSLNPVSGNVVKGSNVPYIPTFYERLHTSRNHSLIITDKNQRNCLPDKKDGIYWERGSNLISGFELFEPRLVLLNGLNGNTDYSGSGNIYEIPTLDHPTTQNWIIQLNNHQEMSFQKMSFQVKYIPMSDLKIEIDNQRSTKDIQLYNQNGKLTDSVALSKMLNSYSREISSNKITKYGTYYDFDDIPKAGQMVKIKNELYVINNVSIDFYANENDSYYMPCEFNLCKYVSTKSLMVNPNTNIRDYGIPQNFNVKRKQLYRDYLEFDYTQDPKATGSFYSNNIPLSFATFGYEPTNHTAIIECGYNHAIDGELFWDYQLETTVYRLDKMHIELVDFNDNNIIGYGSQNTHSNFDVSRIFSGMLDTINTPISYVDENGEVKSIDIIFANKEQLTTAWNDYKTSEGYGDNLDYDLSNFSVFIPSYIFGSLYINDLQISEPQYYKDATEVPVFEYVFQVGDSENVIVGDKILDNITNTDLPLYNVIWLYGFVEGDAGTLNQNNAMINSKQVDDSGLIPVLEDMVVIDDYSDETYFQFINTDTIPTANKDYAIYRVEWDSVNHTELQRQLVMVLKNVPSNAIVDVMGEKNILLYKNKYKLK